MIARKKKQAPRPFIRPLIVTVGADGFVIRVQR